MKKNLVDHLYNIKDANRESDIVNFLVDTRPSPPHANATDDTDMDAMEKAFESIDKETLHLMVFLFMQFLSHPHQAEITENKSCVKYLALQKSFHGLFSLLGYDEKEQRFTTMPHRIR